VFSETPQISTGISTAEASTQNDRPDIDKTVTVKQ
jgi:hypothetical protein